MTITEKYITIAENNRDSNNRLRVRVYYDLGGYNVFTYKEKPRGYYISVSPVERNTERGYITETYSAFTGYCELLFTCTRKSKKAEAAALENAAALEKKIIDYICNKNGYILEA